MKHTRTPAHGRDAVRGAVPRQRTAGVSFLDDSVDACAGTGRGSIQGGTEVGMTRSVDSDWFLPEEHLRPTQQVCVLRSAQALSAFVVDTTITRVLLCAVSSALAPALTRASELAALFHPGNLAGHPVVLVAVAVLPASFVPQEVDDALAPDLPEEAQRWMALYDALLQAAVLQQGAVDDAQPTDGGGVDMLDATQSGAQAAHPYAVVCGAAFPPRGDASARGAMPSYRPPFGGGFLMVHETPGHAVHFIPTWRLKPAPTAGADAPFAPHLRQSWEWTYLPEPAHAVLAAYAQLSGDASAVQHTRLHAVRDAVRLGLVTDARELAAESRGSAPIASKAVMDWFKASGQEVSWRSVMEEAGVWAIAFLSSATPFVARSAAPLYPWLAPHDVMVNAVKASLSTMGAELRDRVWVIDGGTLDLPHLPTCAWVEVDPQTVQGAARAAPAAVESGFAAADTASIHSLPASTRIQSVYATAPNIVVHSASAVRACLAFQVRHGSSLEDALHHRSRPAAARGDGR